MFACRLFAGLWIVFALGSATAVFAQEQFESLPLGEIDPQSAPLTRESASELSVSIENAPLPVGNCNADCDCDYCHQEPLWRPFDFLRDWGFRHSSTHGRHVGLGLPMDRTSWQSRPYHVDWFLGPLLGDNLAANGDVAQANVMFGGLRIGWDIDYYWGLQWRFGWAHPELDTAESINNSAPGSYFISDIGVVYYPWGDSTVRPYVMLGLGVNEVESLRPDGTGLSATLLAMPFGAGVEFPQTPWLAWRLEILDNLAFGANGVDTLNSFSFTVGMDLRLGARPRSYWPWRSSRKVW
ncbi:outer membrane beta-barrel protein [Pirellulales bacterium]|nr:outer membrane beta-barrel protein [Pirellulales bacterium]